MDIEVPEVVGVLCVVVDVVEACEDVVAAVFELY